MQPYPSHYLSFSLLLLLPPLSLSLSIYIYIYIYSSADRLFRCIITLQCGQTRKILWAGIETRLICMSVGYLITDYHYRRNFYGIYSYTLIGYWSAEFRRRALQLRICGNLRFFTQVLNLRWVESIYICIYIVPSKDRLFLLYRNSSLWIDAWDASSLNRNPVDFTYVSYHWAHLERESFNWWKNLKKKLFRFFFPLMLPLHCLKLVGIKNNFNLAKALILRLFKMATNQTESYGLEQRYVIKLLAAEKCKQYEIYRRICYMYKEAFLSKRNV